ncbi:hypothetical protein CHUAL_004619 [Chamberlinius hualienensis]
MGCVCGDDDQTNESGATPRSVTDVLWLIIFILFCFGMVAIAAFAIVFGDPWRLIYGYDSFGNMCGNVNQPLGNMASSGLNLTKEKYLFYFNVRRPVSSLRICVRHCPTRLLTTRDDLVEFAIESGSRLCRYEIPLDRYTSSDPLTGLNIFTDNSSTDFNACPTLPVYPSSPIMNRCIPQSFQNITQDVINMVYGFVNGFDLFQQVMSDVYESWKELIILAAVACILSAIMVLVLHFMVTVVFWIVFIGIGLACCAGTGVLWWTYLDIKKELDSISKDELLEDSARNERAFLCYAIIASVLSVIVMSIMCCCKKKMPEVETLFKEASNCMFDLPCLFFQPVWTMAVLFSFIFFWIYIILSLATSLIPSKQRIEEYNYSDNSSTWFTEVVYVSESGIRYMWWYYIVVLLWMSEVILSCQQMIMAGTIASWYFAEDRKNIRCSTWKMTLNVLIYHLGSVAKGSFLITLCKLPRIIAAYIKQKVTSIENQNCARCCQACCCCCLCSLEKFLKYMNHNAYTVIAFNSRNFCSAAKEAFLAMANEAALVTTVNTVGDFVLFLGKCLVTIITGIVGLLYMKVSSCLNLYDSVN